MFFSWVRRSSLRVPIKGRGLLLLKQGPGQPSALVLTTIAALFAIAGAVTYTQVRADQAINGGAVLQPDQVQKVDGATFPANGVFDETYLTNGKHTIVQASKYGGGVPLTIDVNYDSGPLVALRNWVFSWRHGDKHAVNRDLLWLGLAASVLLVWMGLRSGMRRRVRSKVK